MIGLIDYGAGNIASVSNALNFLKIPHCISSDPSKLLTLNRLIFPGVGASGSAMEVVIQRGLDEMVKEFTQQGKLFLGICVGCQIILTESEESPGISCLDLISGKCQQFQILPENPIHVPHMGWNQVRSVVTHPLLKNIPDNSYFYFVHSYYPKLFNSKYAIANTHYGNIIFPSVFAKDNVMACQFHPEKSGTHGLHLLKNFSEL